MWSIKQSKAVSRSMVLLRMPTRSQTDIKSSLRAGVTIVQYRDKHSDTKDLIETARRLHGITQSHNIPLLINDRIDVALAVGAEGVHLGQDDMSNGR